MPIYRLTPRNLDHKDWQSSLYKNQVVVRAPSEETARWAATAAFKIPSPYVPGTPFRDNPWKQEALVRVTEVADAELEKPWWSDDGPVQILKPVGYNDALQHTPWAWG